MSTDRTAEKDYIISALTRQLVERDKKRLPTIPIGTRVRVHDTSAAGIGTVVGKDGYGFDGVVVIFDPPAPRGFEDGCCAGVEQCEVLSTPSAVTSWHCRECGHCRTPEGCVGDPTPSDLWAGVTPAACDCDAVYSPGATDCGDGQ